MRLIRCLLCASNMHAGIQPCTWGTHDTVGKLRYWAQVQQAQPREGQQAPRRQCSFWRPVRGRTSHRGNLGDVFYWCMRHRTPGATRGHPVFLVRRWAATRTGKTS